MTKIISLLAFLVAVGQFYPALAGAGGDTPPAVNMTGIRYPFNPPLDLSQAYASDQNKVLICYKLTKSAGVNSYYLEPLDASGVSNVKCWNRGEADNDHPLAMHQRLWFAIIVDKTDENNLDSIIVDVSSQSASAINPSPIRPSFPAPSVKTTLSAEFIKSATQDIYYMKWPYRLQGDTVPTVSITAIPKAATAYMLNTDVLPQVHSLSRFNLSTAVVFSTIRSKSFGFSSGTPAVPITTSRNPIIDPVLFLTYYPWPIDAERDWHLSDLRPGISLGFSLSSPTSNFYVGGMSEFPFVRNVEVVYGFAVAKTARLAPTGTFEPTPSSSSATPATVQGYSKGAYVGLSFNVSGFISSLFGGKGGGS